MCGCEAWTLTNAMNNSLEYLSVKSCERCLPLGKLKTGPEGYERIINWVNRPVQNIQDHNTYICQERGQFIKSRRLELLGHVEQIDDSRRTGRNRRLETSKQKK